ncbi:hypothetical protein BpHYR1_002944 [Brachionus plicatilis]|uniref:Uncharacterized protein n=1 Tax=Brachionus plicatilis TaxID=10195 RepID=A0A3M7T4N5_BRAPC|nr:hypothetical protein BpHYR1_002944 [Brachionus plicatilis]
MPTWEIIQTFYNADDAEKRIGKEGSKCTKHDTAITMLNFRQIERTILRLLSKLKETLLEQTQ